MSQEESDMLQEQLQAAAAAASLEPSIPPLDRLKHLKFQLYHLMKMPTPYQSMESNHGMLTYFVFAGVLSNLFFSTHWLFAALDILGALDQIPSREACIDSIYSLQIVVPSDSTGNCILVFIITMLKIGNLELGGFRGGTWGGNPWNPQQVSVS